jgi:type I restriction enzyme, S subunit
MRKQIAFAELVQINPRTRMTGRTVPFIGMEDVSEEGVLHGVRERPTSELSSGLTSFRDHDVLFAKITPCMENGKGAYVTGLGDALGFGSTEFHVLRAASGVEPRYIYHWTRTPRMRRAAAAMMTGSAGQRRVPVQFFSRFRIPNMPMNEQRRIAEILDAVDEQITVTSRKLAKQEGVEQGLVVSGIGAVTQSMSHSECRLGNLAAVASGVTLGNEPSGGSSVKLPYLRVANVQDGYIDTAEIKMLRISRSQIEQFSLRQGDVLLTEGGDWDKLGRGAVWDGHLAPCLYQNHVFRLRCDGRLILPEYLALYVSSPMGKAYFMRIAKQTTNLATINSTQLKAMPVPVPSLGSQRRLVDSLATYEKNLQSERRMLATMLAMKQGLMEDLLSGRVQVKV